MSGTEEASSKTDDVPEVITPGSPGSDFDSSDPNTPLDGMLADTPSPSEQPKRIPSLHGQTGYGAHMNPNSTPGGTLNMARRPHPMSSFAGSAMDNSAFAKARALAQSRSQSRPSLGGVNAGTPPSVSSPQSPASGPNGFPGAGMPGLSRPPIGHPRSAPVVQPSSLSQRRGPMKGMKLSDMGGGSPSPGLSRPGAPKLSDMGGLSNASDPPPKTVSKMDDFKKYIDTEKGWITFDGAATITRTGVNFQNGQTFSISLDEVEILNELGKGNYGTVYKVKHSKPRAPRFGQGLSGTKPAPLVHSYTDPTPTMAEIQADGTTGVTMAMKEIRLELDDAKFTTILKELVILHECVSPYIIDFYGAFFQEGAVYICIEYMDGGSIDKLYSGGIPENVLRKITYSTVHGLKSLKDDHNIIHRDVKPTNILVNTKGQVKICDFGVSGNLVASMARTNIGCQSYMAPERISGGGMAANGNADGTYSVQSDVWSLGLTIIECAMGRYPYPPEVSSTIFSQLSAIVEGDPPDLPPEGYSDSAREFVKSCLHKIPKMRPTYTMLLKHPWLQALSKPQTITEEAEEGDTVEETAEAVGKINLDSSTEDAEVANWVLAVLKRKQEGKDAGNPGKPALHAAPLDSVSPITSPLITANDPSNPLSP